MQSIEPKLLLIDAGNTRVKGALYRGEKIEPVFSVKTAEFEKRTGELLGKYCFNDLIVASVVPKVSRKIKEVFPGALFVSEVKSLLFKHSYRGKLGEDRIANICGGLNYSDSFIVVSCGTATVIDVVVEREFIGGYILPGVQTMAECLSVKGALLPEVNLNKLSEKPGDSTADCIVSGITVSTLGAVERIRKHFQLPLLITGGFGELISELTAGRFIRTLTFEGLLNLWRAEGRELPPLKKLTYRRSP